MSGETYGKMQQREKSGNEKAPSAAADVAREAYVHGGPFKLPGECHHHPDSPGKGGAIPRTAAEVFRRLGG